MSSGLSRIAIDQPGPNPYRAGPGSAGVTSTRVFRPVFFVLGQMVLLVAAVVLGLAAGVNPLLAAAALLGLAYVALVLSDLTIAVGLFTVLAFVESLGGAEGDTSFLKLAGLLLAGVWLVSMLTRRRGAENFAVAHPIAAYALVALVAWVGFTAVWADYPDVAISTTFRLAQQVVLFFVVFTAVSTGRKAVLLLVAAYLLGASISSGIALTDPTASMVDGDGLSRASGGAGDPNSLASLLVPALTLASALVVSRSVSGLARLLALGACGLCLAVFLLTLSRGGMIGLGVALIAAIFVGGRWRWHVVGLAGVVATATICFYAFFADPAAVGRALNPGAEGGSGRSDIWLMGSRMIEDNPIGGIGAGNYRFVSNQYLVRVGVVQRDDYILDDPKQAHNMYLDIAAETGVIGLALFVGVIGFSLWSTLQAARKFRDVGEVDMELLARATLVGLIGLLVACAFLSEQFSKQLWILLALGPALMRVANGYGGHEKVAGPPSSSGASLSRRAAGGSRSRSSRTSPLSGTVPSSVEPARPVRRLV